MTEDCKTWIYHATKSPKIINISEYEQMSAEGWADSPAKFLKLETIGISQEKITNGDVEEAAKAQQALDAVEGVKDYMNGSLNLNKMNKQELEDYAKHHFGVNLDRRLKPSKMITQIKDLMES
tara:strand:+ start:1888 stop:2256 length:369 start_codon:yes stop_codon:yes gene_type:complete